VNDYKDQVNKEYENYEDQVAVALRNINIANIFDE
jgi:hypothetical protein